MQTTIEQAAPSAASAPATLAGLPRRTAWIYLALFMLAFVGYALIWPKAPYASGDSAGYMAVARRLVGAEPPRLEERVPGLPLLLAWTGSAVHPTHWFFYVSMLLNFAGIWALGAALHATGIGERWLQALAVLLLTPPAMEPAAYILSENLARAVLVSGFASIVLWQAQRRWVWLIPAAVFIAASALVRPVYQALGVFLAVGLVAMPRLLPSARLRLKDALRPALAIGLVSVLVVGGYVVMNGLRYGYYGVTPLLGFNLCTRTAPLLERLPASYGPVRETLLHYRNADLVKPFSTHTGAMYIWAPGARKELSRLTGLDEAHLSRYMLRLNLELIARAPQEYLQEVLHAAADYGLPTWQPVRGMSSVPARMFWLIAHFAAVGAFLLQLVALSGAALFLRARRQPGVQHTLEVDHSAQGALQVYAYAVAAAIVFYTMALSCLVEVGNPRYRVPTDSLALGMVILGASIWRRMLRSEQAQEAAAQHAPKGPHAG